MESLTAQTIKIRPVRTEDLKAVYAIEDACFKDPFPPYFIDQLASANPDTFLVATDGDRIVGYAVVDSWTDHRHLVSIAVLSDSRRKGIGQALLDGLYGQLTDGPLRLELRKSNQAALELYLKNGFYQTGLAYNYYTDGEDAIQMEKIIHKKVEVISAA
jgi:ribosomal-protein-alanine N-acetyltransferase